MLALAIRTDKPIAELYVHDGSTIISQCQWEAHRELSNTIDTKIAEVLQKCKSSVRDITKVAVYEGPGSFTGLRIGFSVANAIGYSLGVPVISAGGEKWIDTALASKMDSFSPQSPKYGSEPNITKPRK